MSRSEPVYSDGSRCNAGPRMMDGALRALAECAMASVGADVAWISLESGAQFVTQDVVRRPLRSGSDGDGVHMTAIMEPLVGSDGRQIGCLTLSPCRSNRAGDTTMLRGLACVAAALLEQGADRVPAEITASVFPATSESNDPGFEAVISVGAPTPAATQRSEAIFEKSPSPSWIYDPRTLRFLDVNEAAVRFYGYSRERFLSMTVLDIQPPEEHPRMLDSIRNRTDLDAKATSRHHKANGQKVDVVTHGQTVMLDGLEAIIVVAIDRTDVLALRQSLTETQLTFETIIAALPIGLFLKDMAKDGRYVLFNQAQSEIVGQDAKDVVGRQDHEIFGVVEGNGFTRQDLDVMRIGRQQTYEADTINCRHVRRVRTLKKPLPAPAGEAPRYLLGISQDITESYESQRRIAHMALHDALTDLPNRVQFQQHVDKLLKRARSSKRLALLYMDLDFFKTINDTYGHHTGDRLLKDVAARLRSAKPRGAMVARLGGDEFAIVTRVSGGEEEALRIAERILKGFDQPFELGECVAHVDASIGIALPAASRQDSGEALMRHADIALYAAKAAGRGIAKVYVDRMSHHVEARQMMSEDLRRAVAGQEFELDYQPLHDLVSDRITGFEALVRWRHPSRGLISPGDFIPVAEQTGLIVPIGEWVLREACLNAGLWPDSMKIAVNLSAVQFRKNGLVDMIERTLAETGLSPDRLELEITESVLLSDSGANLQILHRLRALGVRIAMDDFGTGYSSLSYLRSFPFDKIKMDRSFVTDVCDNAESLAIVRAVTGLGSSLSITTTAEGIETPEQFARLKAEGFDELQGYLIGRPMPAGDAKALAHAQGAAPGKSAAAA